MHNVASASVLDYLELADEHSIVEIKASEKWPVKQLYNWTFVNNLALVLLPLSVVEKS